MSFLLSAIAMICTAASLYLEKRFPFAAKIGACVLALFFGTALSNLRLIPQSSIVWDRIWDTVIPASIPLLLFQCNLKGSFKKYPRMILLFLLGSLGTGLGAVLAFFLLRNFIPYPGYFSGIFAGTYIGGSLNFLALSESFSLPKDLIASATVADNVLMVGYFFILSAIPSIPFFSKYSCLPCGKASKNTNTNAKLSESVQKNTLWSKIQYLPSILRTGNIRIFFGFGICIGLSWGIAMLSSMLSAILLRFFSRIHSPEMLAAFLSNRYIWITVLSLFLSSCFSDFFQKQKSSHALGTFGMTMLFFVIGIPSSIAQIFSHAPWLFLFALIIVAVHMICIFSIGAFLRLPLEEIILASNANIGGPTTAAAMAVSKGWTDLIAPSVVVGALGYVLGTYVGLLLGRL